MLIVCPNCATSYRVEPASLGAAGRSVRCVRCRTVWFAPAPAPLPDAAAPVTSVSSDDPGEPAALPPGDEAAPAEPLPGGDTTAAAAGPEQATADLDVRADDEAPASLADRQEFPLPPLREPAAMAEPTTLAPLETHGVALLADPLPADDIETFAARRVQRRAARRRPHWPLPGLPAALLMLVALNAALVGWRADVVRLVPQTASLYAAIGLPVNLRGLAFANVASATETHEGVPVLVVEGSIVSANERVAEVPRLRFSVRNRGGQEIYAWTALPSRSVLAPGETLAFRSRLASPPPEAHDVLVRFFNRRDRVAGIQ
jgi:predicted Zn finger-like uncharacterized protein